MRIKTISLLAAAFLLAALATLPSASQAQEKPAEKTHAPYASPDDVFDAYCKAMKHSDCRALLSCSTPELQERLVFLTIAECNVTDQSAVHAVLKAYDVRDSSELKTDYNEKFKEKHGVGPANWQSAPDAQRARIIADLEAETVAGARYDLFRVAAEDISAAFPKTFSNDGDFEPPKDFCMLRGILTSRITDNADFFDKIAKSLIDGRDADFSAAVDKAAAQDGVRLSQVLIKDNTATGYVNMSLHSIDSHSEKTDVTSAETVELTYYFRKSKGGWLFDGVLESPMQKDPLAAPHQ